MNPAASPASSSPSSAPVADLDSERTQDGGRAGQPRSGKSIAQHRIARQFADQRRVRIAEAAIARLPGLHETHVGQAAGHRRNADIPARPDVHFTQVAGRLRHRRIFHVHANRPPARARRMARQPEAERQRRMAAVGGNRHARRQLALELASAHPGAGDTVSIDERPADGERRFELRAGGEGVLEQHPVEMAAQQGAPADAIRIASFDRPRRALRSHACRRPAARTCRSPARRSGGGGSRAFRDSPYRRTACRAETCCDRRCARAHPPAPESSRRWFQPGPLLRQNIQHLVIWSSGHLVIVDPLSHLIIRATMTR